jgi:hypothetical protein
MNVSRTLSSLLRLSLFTALSLSVLTACPSEKTSSDDSSQTEVAANTEASTPEEKTAGEDMPAANENLPQSVNFTSPENDAKVKSPVKVVMQVQGMEVHPAGEVTPNSGHHHLIIDGESVAEGEVLPADEKHIHFGQGQTETEVELTPGKHTLTLQFANGAHQSYGPDMSQTITVEVTE